MKGHILPGQVVQWMGQAREVLHKNPVVGRQSAKRPDFGNVCWPWPTSYGGYFVWIAFDPLVTYNMAKKGDLMLKQMALGWLEFQCVPLQSVKDGSQSVTVFLEALLKDQDVV